MVGEIDGKIIAMGGFRKKSSDTVEMKRMRVDPQFQRRGYGQLILNMLEQRAREMGYKKMILDTTIRSKAAVSLYIKNGYKETGRRDVAQFNTVLIFFEKQL